MMLTGPLKIREFKDSGKFRPMPAYAYCADCHGSILFANALKVALQIFGRTFYKNTKTNHPYTPTAF